MKEQKFENLTNCYSLFGIDSGIKNPEYLESLNWEKNIRVINYTRYHKYPDIVESPRSFLLHYEDRQRSLLYQINQIAKYIRENDLQEPKDIGSAHITVLRTFIVGIDDFFAKTTFFGLNVKKAEYVLYRKMLNKYPHLESNLLLSPSFPPSPILKMLKASEYCKGQNNEFVYMYCAGSAELAFRVVRKLDAYNEAKLRELVRENSIKKGYLMMGRDDIKLLDRLLIVDNTVENWIWKDSWVTAPLYHIYNMAQETICPSGSFVKEKYVFDIKLIKDNF